MIVLFKRFAVLSSALFCLTACTDRSEIPGLPGLAAAISDAVHEGGTAGFYFLPPMVPQPIVSGSLDRDITTLSPAIAICDITGGPDNNCGGAGGTAPRVVFTTASTPAISVDPSNSQYQVNWDTKGSSFTEGHTYRVHVAAGANGSRRELGFADVLLTTTPGQAKQLATGDLITLQDGRTLPIHFRVETAITGSLAVSAASSSVTAGGTDLITATVLDLHGALVAGTSVAWSVTTTPVTGVADATQPLNPTSGQTGVTGTTTSTFKAGSAAGTATISATTGGLSASSAITVRSGNFTFVSAGFKHTCALTAAGQAYCWGDSPTQSAVPIALPGGLTFSQLSGGGNSHSCGLTSNGQAYCWGGNNHGQLGDGTFSDNPVPVEVGGGLSFASITVGGDHSCALTASGEPYCWGFGIGYASPMDHTAPVAVNISGLSFATLSAGQVFTCGLTAAGQLYCWGGSIGGSPAYVVGNSLFSSVSAGWVTIAGLTTAGEPVQWGETTPQGSFVPGSTGLEFNSVAAGIGHVCGIITNGQAFCWGDNSVGELGDGTSISSSIPVTVSGGFTFAQIASGAGHACGVTTNGRTYCWGSNERGQLGNGSFTNGTAPVAVAFP